MNYPNEKTWRKRLGWERCARGKVREVRPEEREELSFPNRELN